MRLKDLLAAVAVGALASLAVVAPAAAVDWKWDPSVAPEGHELSSIIEHRVYKPRYHHIYRNDPYKYRYARRGYYPYFASQYWVPAEAMRNRYRYAYSGPKYTYYPAWGLGGHDSGSHSYRGKPSK